MVNSATRNLIIILGGAESNYRKFSLQWPMEPPRFGEPTATAGPPRPFRRSLLCYDCKRASSLGSTFLRDDEYTAALSTCTHSNRNQACRYAAWLNKLARGGELWRWLLMAMVFLACQTR